MSTAKTTTQVWRITPRDPLVAGNGLQPYAFGTDVPHLLPPPSTVAGAVRAQFVPPGAKLTPTEIEALLGNIRIRRYWLAYANDDPPLVAPPADAEVMAKLVGPLVAPPADAEVMANSGGKLGFSRIEAATVETTPGEGMWCAHDGGPSFTLDAVTLPSHRTGEKGATGRDVPSLWPWAAALQWAIGKPVGPGDFPAPRDNAGLTAETRVHVSIDDQSGTAEAGALFSSRGRRYRGICLHIEVESPDRRPDGMITLGGESRLSFLSDGTAFPSFASAEPTLFPADERRPLRGLRLQLLTPAWCDPNGDPPRNAGWLPRWIGDDGRGAHPRASGVKLRLVAAAIPGFTAISGWDMQAVADPRSRGAPRAVRRLVPQGSVYYFEVLAGTVRDACKLLWGEPIEPSAGARPPALTKEHLAHPGDDGFGTLLPSPWYDPSTEESP